MLVTVENGRAVEVRGAPDHPPTGGTLCTKVAHYLERTYSDQRVLYPMRRVGTQGRRAVRADHAGTKRSTRSPKSSARLPPRRTVRRRSSRTVRGDDGTPPIRLDGPALLPPARRLAARPDDLRDRGQGGLGGGDRRVDRHRCRAVREQSTDPDLGQQSGRLEPALLDARAGGEAARREADRDRSLSQPDRRQVSRAHRAAARHRRGAGARHDARADRRGSVDHDYIDRYTRGLRRARARAAPNIRRNASRRSAESACEQIVALARDYGTITARGHPAQLWNAAPRRRRQCGARDRLPAGAGRRVARSRRRRAAVVVGHVPGGCRGAGAARPDPRQAAHDQHERDRRRVAGPAGSADPRHSTSTTRTPSPWRRNRRRSPPASRATTSSASSTRSSRPTPPTTPTSCCRRRLSSSRPMSTARTATCTRSRTTRRSRRWARPSPTPRCSGCSPRAWASASPAFATATTTSRARRTSRRTRARRGLDWDTLKANGFQRLSRAGGVRTVRARQFPDAVGQVRVLFGEHSLRRVTIRCRRSFRRANRSRAIPSLARRYPLAFLSPPARNFLNSSFANLRGSPTAERTPTLDINPDDAEARGIATGDTVRILQRSRRLRGPRPRHRPRASGRRRRAVDLVEEALGRRRQRERRHEPGADGSGSRRDVLRLPRRGDKTLSAVEHGERRAGQHGLDVGALRLRVGPAELEQCPAESGREEQIREQRPAPAVHAADRAQQRPDRPRQLGRVRMRKLLQRHARRDKRETDVAQRYRARRQAIGEVSGAPRC